MRSQEAIDAYHDGRHDESLELVRRLQASETDGSLAALEAWNLLESGCYGEARAAFAKLYRGYQSPEALKGLRAVEARNYRHDWIEAPSAPARRARLRLVAGQGDCLFPARAGGAFGRDALRRPTRALGRTRFSCDSWRSNGRPTFSLCGKPMVHRASFRPTLCLPDRVGPIAGLALDLVVSSQHCHPSEAEHSTMAHLVTGCWFLLSYNPSGSRAVCAA
jgi:hypothetical protein